jgi:5-methyltetrahydrofolate--homocysteine methyltransferase
VTGDELRARAAVRPLLLDGGLGSLFIAAGLPAGVSPVLWNLEHPERVAAAHRSYAEAGSDIVHTNTFGANPVKLAGSGLAGRCREVNARAVELARDACPRATLIAGDIGPTGLLLPPIGAASEAELENAFAEQASALADAGADVLSIETMYDLREALAAVRAARRTGLAVVASLTCEARKRGAFTIMGDPLVASLAALAAAGADAVGCNCSVTAEVMLGMVQEAAPRIAVPLAAQPNAGQPRVTPGGVVYDESVDDFARQLAAMVRAGARLVGGCCGTDPAFIRAARSALAGVP